MGKIQIGRVVVIDLETTGLDPVRDNIIQVGAVALDGELSPCGEFEAKIRFDERNASKVALEANAFERELWDRDAFAEMEAATRFSAFLREHATLVRRGAHGKIYTVAQLATFNAEFDARFLHAWFERVHEFLPADRRVLCLLQRAHWALTESSACAFPKNLKLGTLCRELGIPLGENAHDALHDARAAASLYRAIHGLPPLLPESTKPIRARRPSHRKSRSSPRGEIAKRRAAAERRTQKERTRTTFL